MKRLIAAAAALLLAAFLIWHGPKTSEHNGHILTAHTARSNHWPVVRAAHLKKEPRCAACGSSDPAHIEVHHIRSFAEDPSLELDDGNLITLCRTPARPCHFIFGHLGSYQNGVNPKVREDAAAYKLRLHEHGLEKK
jgi:hypothetical protein